MKLNIQDEFSVLKTVAVCWGRAVPQYSKYKSSDPQELRWGWRHWNKDLLLRQQDEFFSRLSVYGVELIMPRLHPSLAQQMYIRDTGFVLGDTLYYSKKRTLKIRHGEIEQLLAKMGKIKMQPLTARIEGGDVLASKISLVGISNRTQEAACTQLAKYVEAQPLFLGESVMHLDTRLTLLPNNYALVYLESFRQSDRQYLKSLFKLLPVTKAEAKNLATNVLVVNPETIFVEKSQKRTQDLLKTAGFKLESLDYSEPIALGGSFRCTSLPLVRE